jgi:serine kinase of HPr protein (carbohydrate metabolism regulator)
MKAPDLSSETIHASCVAIGRDDSDRRAVLIVGRSGAGKSDLALRLIDRGGVLIADDYVMVRRNNAALLAFAPPNIAGRIEVRGLGIVDMPHVEAIPVALLIEVDQPVPRMPDEPLPRRRLAGVEIPMIALAPFEPSAAIKAEHAVAMFGLPR